MKKFLMSVPIFLLFLASIAYADYYNYWTWDTGYPTAYGVEGWVGNDGISRIIFYSGNTAYVYQVTTDGNPDLHPNNPEATGPIATRTFTFEKSFTLHKNNYSHECEFYVGSDGFYLGAKNGIEKYDFNGNYITTIGPPAPIDDGWSTQSLAYDPTNNIWYAGSLGAWGGGATRTIYKLDGDNPVNWEVAFTYISEPGSSHHDGLEFLPNGHLLLADYKGQIVEYTVDGTKIAVHDHDPFPTELEGMGAGALGHYWGGSHWGKIFEFGCGSLPPPEEPIPEPGTMLLLGLGFLGLAGISRKRFSKKVKK